MAMEIYRQSDETDRFKGYSIGLLHLELLPSSDIPNNKRLEDILWYLPRQPLPWSLDAY